MERKDIDLIKELMPCVRCGQCRSVCPVFLAKGVESDAPRGKVALVRALLEGKLEPSEALIEKLDQCLLCRTCVQDCPSGVRVDRIIIAARERLPALRGGPVRKKSLTPYLISNRSSPWPPGCKASSEARWHQATTGCRDTPYQ